MFYITTLTIAGSDCSGGAGIQADIKTMSALGCYAASVITSVTSQNTSGVYGIYNVPSAAISSQIKSVMDDIRPMAIKIGMVNDSDSVKAIADSLYHYKIRNLIIDPIMVSSSGVSLMNKDTIKIFCDRLVCHALLLTPNIPEAEVLSDIKITDEESISVAATRILKTGCRYVLIKGGHIEGDIKTDYLYTLNGDKGVLIKKYSTPTVNTPNTHGTGCTMSSAITSYIARGLTVVSAIGKAKEFMYEALHTGAEFKIGKGKGPVCHFFKPEKVIPRSLYVQFITHHNEHYSYLDSAMLALKGGCRWIQLRMKDVSDKEFLNIAETTQSLCRKYNAVFIIDDHVDIALKIKADGVHLGKNDMPADEARNILGNGFIIGGTANTFEDIERLYCDGVDYIGCGPFRFTTTKKNLSPILGLSGYENIVNRMKAAGITTPVVAIGGIENEDIHQIMQTGINGIALSGAILNAAKPIAEMKRIMNYE